MVTSALGYTPYNNTNPSGFISASIAGTFTASEIDVGTIVCPGIDAGAISANSVWGNTISGNLGVFYGPVTATTFTGAISASQVTGILNQGTVIGYAHTQVQHLT
jgi:hypothetical protein